MDLKNKTIEWVNSNPSGTIYELMEYMCNECNIYVSSLTFSGFEESMTENIVMVGNNETWKLNQSKAYNNIENIPDIEVSLNKVLDGYPLVYNRKKQEDTQNE